MEGLVNYGSEDEQDDYSYTKVAVRERVGGSGAGTSTGRTAADVTGQLKRKHEYLKSGSSEREASLYRKDRDTGSECYKSGGNGNNETKYKIDRRADKSRDQRDKRDIRESRHNRDMRDDNRDLDNGHKYDYKKHDEYKRYREPKRDCKRDEKKYSRYDDRKSTYVPNSKDRINTSKSRYDDRKQYDERFNDERKGGGNSGGGSSFDERRRDFNGKRSYNNEDDRKPDRRNNDDRRTQRLYNQDRLNAYRSRRSSSPASSHRNSNDNKYNERSTRRERRRHSRSRSRSRSRSPSDDNAIECNLATSNSHQKTAIGELTQMKHPVLESPASEKKVLPSARNFEALLTVPIGENAPKPPNIVTVPGTSAAAGSSTATATVQLPSYYNPNVINPNKYVEQMQKRKLIWGAKKTDDSVSKWGHAQFSQDQDGKVASKFMRLMGIKNTTGGAGESLTSPSKCEKKSPSSITPPNSTDVKSREAMFSTMEQQYEVARQVTHTMRGVGLGFGSSRPY